MNVNFGLFPPLTQDPLRDQEGRRLRGPAKSVARKQALCARALADLDRWRASPAVQAAE
jgi:methylenetetrahydrofolate--tRNA-(uracil-5-)-methyltransferase